MPHTHPKASHFTCSPYTRPEGPVWSDSISRPHLLQPTVFNSLFQPHWPLPVPWMCQSSANLRVCALSLEHSSQPPTRLIPSLSSGLHSKVTLSIGFPWIPYLNGTPIPLPSIPITFFRMNKKRWRKDMRSRSPEGPGSNYITIQYNHKDGLLLPRVHPGPAGMWWHEPHFSSRSIPLAH